MKILNEKDGIICNFPKSCVREFFSAGYIEEDNAKILLEMLDDRNLTSHTYHEEVAEIIFSKLGKYIDNLKFVSSIVKFDRKIAMQAHKLIAMGINSFSLCCPLYV